MSNSHIRITPSVLNAERGNLSAEIAKIARVSDLIHLDIMDNKFVPNMTWNFSEAEQIQGRRSAQGAFVRTQY